MNLKEVFFKQSFLGILMLLLVIALFIFISFSRDEEFKGTITGRTADYPEELVAYFKLDDSGADATNQRYNAEIVGAIFVKGVDGKAADFDGTDDYIKILNSGAYDKDEGTWILWIKSNISPVESRDNKVVSTIIDRFDSDYKNGLGIYLRENGNLNCESNDNYAREVFSFNTETKILDGKWHQIAITFNGEKGALNKLYIDGVEENFAESAHKWNFNDQPIMIGKSSGPWWGYFQGTIDEVRIYDKELSADEIKNLYDELAPQVEEVMEPQEKEPEEQPKQTAELNLSPEIKEEEEKEPIQWIFYFLAGVLFGIVSYTVYSFIKKRGK